MSDEAWVDELDALVATAVVPREQAHAVVPGAVRAIEPKVRALAARVGLGEVKRALAAHVIALELKGSSEAAGALATLLRALIATGHKEAARGSVPASEEDEFSP